jgi:hypothetical protein
LAENNVFFIKLSILGEIRSFLAFLGQPGFPSDLGQIWVSLRGWLYQRKELGEISQTWLFFRFGSNLSFFKGLVVLKKRT